MAQNVKVKETVCVAGACAIHQKVEKVTMVTTASVMMTTVRSFRINFVEVELQSISYYAVGPNHILQHTG